ncbi:hypothetical protein ABTX84_19180 [Streptomyces sp. NPDC095614]|uniref:hypothetical protein n=1 Tax=Streptomyces sp. NPDC095614 TaxID=3156692 RepID=UPI003317C71D
MTLPEQHTPVGQPAPTSRHEVRKLAHAVEEALLEEMAKTSYRDETPLPAVGDTPPVAQPGPPPMSQWAIDASGILRGVAIASVPVGGALWVVGQVQPLTLGIIFGSPVALALAVGRLVSHIKNTVEAAPATHHHHYKGPVTVDQRSINTQTRGVIANTRNQGQ